jgi:hypothetical protein
MLVGSGMGAHCAAIDIQDRHSPQSGFCLMSLCLRPLASSKLHASHSDHNPSHTFNESQWTASKIIKY